MSGVWIPIATTTGAVLFLIIGGFREKHKYFERLRSAETPQETNPKSTQPKSKGEPARTDE